MRKASQFLCMVAGLATWGASTEAVADVIPATPANYRSLLSTLQPGDVLELAPGSYPRLTLRDLQGTPDAWITVRGPVDGEPAVITSESCCNTVQLYNCAYVAIENLSIDVGGLAVDAINAKTSISHDIRIEGNTLYGFPTDNQQIVGISTKSTAWRWVIRRNRIIEPGTGLYLGNSNGAAPFIGGVIEENVVLRPLGYCMEIKHQNAYELLEGMPEGPNTTVIRHNVFMKDDRPSPSGDRPNLLVSGFPDTGPGSEDRYEIYGNVLVGNPRESLFQGAGRMSIHDNLFIGTPGAGRTALLITPHQGKGIQIAHAYHNTVYGVGRGIRITTAATVSDAVVGNLVFADTPIGGTISDNRDNVTDSIANASSYVRAPSGILGEMDFYPLIGAVTGTAIDMTKLEGDVDFDRDFNGQSKGGFTFRGAYAGEGDNPGWLPVEGIKGVDLMEVPPDDAGVVVGDAGLDDAGRGDEAGMTTSDGGMVEASDGGATTRDSGVHVSGDGGVPAAGDAGLDQRSDGGRMPGPDEEVPGGCACSASSQAQGRTAAFPLLGALLALAMAARSRCKK